MVLAVLQQDGGAGSENSSLLNNSLDQEAETQRAGLTKVRVPEPGSSGLLHNRAVLFLRNIKNKVMAL